jgi:hypothetical protein
MIDKCPLCKKPLTLVNGGLKRLICPNAGKYNLCGCFSWFFEDETSQFVFYISDSLDKVLFDIDTSSIYVEAYKISFTKVVDIKGDFNELVRIVNDLKLSLELSRVFV